jgi:hypothetical protein
MGADFYLSPASMMIKKQVVAAAAAGANVSNSIILATPGSQRQPLFRVKKQSGNGAGLMLIPR